MSIYTTQLRWPIEQRQHTLMSAPDDFSGCYEMLGLDDYPIFDETYRAALNDKIIRHFYFREIGFETLGQFRWFMRRTMWENMPYFNQLYESQNLITDPITNRKYGWSELWNSTQGGTTSTATSDRTTHGGTDVRNTTDDTVTDYGRTQSTVNGGSDLHTEGATHERVIMEDTPQNLIPNGAIENLNYATEVTYTDRNGVSADVTQFGGTTNISNGGSDETESNGTSTTRYGHTVDGAGTTAYERDLDESGERSHNISGYDGIAPADLLEKYRKTFLNVDLQVIASLETLFFGLWM